MNALGRWWMVASLAGAWASASVHVLAVEGLPYAPGWAVHFSGMVRPAGWAALSVVLGIALVVFGWRRSALAGVVALAVLLLGGWLEVWQWSAADFNRYGKRLPVAAFAAYLLGSLAVGKARREWAGVEAACGVVAAGYVLAGIAKLQAAGLGWVAGGPLALLVAERGGEGWVGAVRSWLAGSPGVCGALAAGALLIELGGVAFLVPRLRWAFAAAAVALHGGIALALGYWYVPWVLLVVGLAVSTTSGSSGHPAEPVR